MLFVIAFLGLGLYYSYQFQHALLSTDRGEFICPISSRVRQVLGAFRDPPVYVPPRSFYRARVPYGVIYGLLVWEILVFFLIPSLSAEGHIFAGMDHAHLVWLGPLAAIIGFAVITGNLYKQRFFFVLMVALWTFRMLISVYIGHQMHMVDYQSSFIMLLFLLTTYVPRLAFHEQAVERSAVAAPKVRLFSFPFYKQVGCMMKRY